MVMHVPVAAILLSNGIFQLINHKIEYDHETLEHKQDIDHRRVAGRKDHGIKRTEPDASGADHGMASGMMGGYGAGWMDKWYGGIWGLFLLVVAGLVVCVTEKVNGELRRIMPGLMSDCWREFWHAPRGCHVAFLPPIPE